MKKRKQFLPLKIVAILSILLTILIPSIVGLSQTSAQEEALKISTKMDLENLGVGLGIVLDLEDTREIGDIITERNSSLPQPSLDSSYEEQLDEASVKRQWVITVPEGMSFDEESQKNLLLSNDPEAEVPLYKFNEETRELLIEAEDDSQQTSILLIIDDERKYELSVSDANLPVTSNTIEFSVKGKVDPAGYIDEAVNPDELGITDNETQSISPMSADNKSISPMGAWGMQFDPVAGLNYLQNVTQGNVTINQTTLQPYVNGGDVMRHVVVLRNNQSFAQYLAYMQFEWGGNIYNHSMYSGEVAINGQPVNANVGLAVTNGEWLRVTVNRSIEPSIQFTIVVTTQFLDNITAYPPGQIFVRGGTYANQNTVDWNYGMRLNYRFNVERIVPTVTNQVSSNGNALNTTSTTKPSSSTQYLSAGDRADFTITSTVADYAGVTVSGLPANNIVYKGKVDPTVFPITSNSLTATYRVGSGAVSNVNGTIDSSGNITITLPASQTLTSGQTLTINFSLTSSTSLTSDERTSLTSNITMTTMRGIVSYAVPATTEFWYSSEPGVPEEPTIVTATMENTISSDGVELDVTSASMPTDATKYLSPGDTANFQSKITVDNGVTGTDGLPVSSIVYTAQVDPAIFAITAGAASNANVSADIDGTSAGLTYNSTISATGLLTLRFYTSGALVVRLTKGQTLTINFSLPTQQQNGQNVRTRFFSTATMTDTSGSTVDANNVTTQFWYEASEQLSMSINPVSDNNTDIDALGNAITDVSGKIISGSTGIANGYVLLENNGSPINPQRIPDTMNYYTLQSDADGNFSYDVAANGVTLVATQSVNAIGYSSDLANQSEANTVVVDRTAPTGTAQTVTVEPTDAKPTDFRGFIDTATLADTNPTVAASDISVTYASGNDAVNNWITNNGTKPDAGTYNFKVYLADPTGNQRLVDVVLEITAPAPASVTVRFVNEWNSTQELNTGITISGTVGETINVQQNVDYRVEAQLLNNLGWTLVNTPTGDTSFTFADTNADLVYTFQKATSIAVNFLELETGNALMPAISSRTIDGYVGQTINLRNQVQSEINTITNSNYSLDVSKLPAGDSSFTFADAVPNAEQTYYFLGGEATLTVYLRNYFDNNRDNYIEMFTITGRKGETVNIDETAEFKASEDRLKSYFPTAIVVSVAQRPWNSTSYVLGSEPTSDPNPSVEYLYTISMPFSIELVNKYDNSLLEQYIGGTSLEAMVGDRIAPSWDSAFMARYDYWTDPDRGGYTLSAGESLDTTYVVPISWWTPLQISLHLEKPATLTVNFLKSGTNEVLRPPQTITGNYYGQRINLRDLAQSDIDAVIADETYVLDESRLPTNETQFYLQDPFISGNPGDSSVTYYFNDSLYLKTAPATIEFGPQNVRNYGELTVTDFDYDTPLVVTDNRPTKNEWRLTATLTQVFTSVNTPSQTLPTALWYKNDAGEQALRLNQPIDLLANTDANKGDYNVSNVEWNTKQNGFIFKLQSNDYRELDDYNARIRYTLVDAP